MNQVGGAAAKETWTDEVTDLPPKNFRGAGDSGPGEPDLRRSGGRNHEFRCVADATN